MVNLATMWSQVFKLLPVVAVQPGLSAAATVATEASPVTVAAAVVHLSQRQASTVEQAATVLPPAAAAVVVAVLTVVSTVATVATAHAPKSDCGCTDDRKHFSSR